MPIDGTHSVLDVNTVVDADADDGFGTLRPLRPQECAALFGSATPGRADVERVEDQDPGALFGHGQRWSGYAVTLYDAGRPSEIVIWGFSGD